MYDTYIQTHAHIHIRIHTYMRVCLLCARARACACTYASSPALHKSALRNASAKSRTGLKQCLKNPYPLRYHAQYPARQRILNPNEQMHMAENGDHTHRENCHRGRRRKREGGGGGVLEEGRGEGEKVYSFFTVLVMRRKLSAWPRAVN